MSEEIYELTRAARVDERAKCIAYVEARAAAFSKRLMAGGVDRETSAHVERCVAAIGDDLRNCFHYGDDDDRKEG